MSEIQTIAKQILGKIKLLEKGRALLEKSAIAKSNTIAEYEKELSKTMLLLKNIDRTTEIKGKLVDKTPATLIPNIAKGLCWKERLEMDKAESFYKINIEKLRCIQAELNGLQSINRYLDET